MLDTVLDVSFLFVRGIFAVVIQSLCCGLHQGKVSYMLVMRFWLCLRLQALKEIEQFIFLGHVTNVQHQCRELFHIFTHQVSVL